MKLKLPIWLDKGEAQKLKNALEVFWANLLKRIKTPFEQFNLDTCDERLLFLFAYQRDVKRLKNEPIELFRKRIKYAHINAEDSGSVTGFIKIFERLGIGTIQLEERAKGYDWDVVKIILTDNQISQNHELLDEIIRQYGRTCRRYFFEIINIQKIKFNCGHFQHEKKHQGSTFKFNRNHLLKIKATQSNYSEVKAYNGAKYE